MTTNPHSVHVRAKQRRQAALLDLIKRHPAANQSEIVNRLKETGLLATQASVSRDVRELGLIKIRGHYMPAATAVPAMDYSPDEPETELITNIEPIGANLVIIHTTPGAASSVGVVLDDRKLPEVAATIAGDDTIFVAVRSRADQGRLIAWLRAWARLDAAQLPAAQTKGGG